MDLKIKQTPDPFTCLYVFFLSPNLVMPFPHLSLSDLASCCIHRVVFVLIYIHCNPEIALRLQMFCKKLVYRPLHLLGRLAAAGEMSLIWTLSVPPSGSATLLGRGESIFIIHFLSNPANEASLRATWASEGGNTNTQSGGRQRPCRSINQSIYKCIHAHPVTKYFSRITQYTWKYIRSFFTLTKKQPDHGLLRRIMTIRVAGIVGLLDGYHCDKQDDNVGFWGHCHTADWSPFVHNHSLCSSEQVSWVSLFGILVCSEVGITNVTAQSMVFLGLTYFYDGSYAGESVS